MGKSVGAKGLEFKWGKKRGTGGTEKDIQFYESFTYDGDEYCLYDCVLAADPNEPDTAEPFIGKIIKIWENTSKPPKYAKKVKLLWFLKPSEIEPLYLEGVPDILANELFLASGEGPGLANTNRLEALSGKCSVLCISKDKRNPQPSQEEIKSTDFVFHRTFDVGSCKVLDTIDDTIAGVDVQFIFNREGCKKEAVQNLEADINGNADNLKANVPLASGLVRETEDNVIEPSDCRENSHDCKERKGKGHNQLATEEPTLTVERSNKDSDVQEGRAHNEHDPCGASGSRGDHCDGKAQESELATGKTTLAEERSNKDSGMQEDRARSENDLCEASASRGNHGDGKAQESEIEKQFTKQKSMRVEETDGVSCEASGSRENHYDAEEAQANNIRNQLTKQKSMPTEERKEKGHNQLATKKPTFREERLNKDSGVQEGRAHNKHDPCEASDSRENHCDGKARESGVKKQFTKQKSMRVEETDGVSGEASGSRENHYDAKEAQANNIRNQLTKQKSMPAEERKERGRNQEATKKPTFREERSNKDSGMREDKARRDGKARESEVKKQFTKQKSMPAEARDGISRETSVSRVNHSSVKKAQANDSKKQLTKQKSMPGEARYGKDLNGLDNRPQKKQKLDGSVTLPDAGNANMLQSIRSNVTKEIESRKSPREKVTGDEVSRENPSFVKKNNVTKEIESRKSPREKVTGDEVSPENPSFVKKNNVTKEIEFRKSPREKVTGDEVSPENPSFVKKKRDLGLTVSEGKDAKTATGKGLSEKPTLDGKLLKHSGEKMLADNKERSYQVITVSRKPDAVKPTWYGTLPWEESVRDAEEKGKLVLLENLDPTYTSAEVEDIVYSALNEQCTARMIERTSATIPHTGQALVIFSSREAAERAVRRLDEGCLLLSNGRPLVAALAKINPPGKPSSFYGHIKLNKLQVRREMREAVATSHCIQENNIESEMAMDWCLHRKVYDQAYGDVFKRQSDEAKSLRINFKPKRP